MDALPVGNYVLIAQNNKDTSEVSPVKSYTIFKVSALAVTQRLLGDNENQYLVLSALNGKPLQDVQIQESFSTYVQNKNIANKGQLLLTNEQGEVFIKKQFDSGTASIVNGTDSLILQVNNYNYQQQTESKRVVLFTDWPIYRPGQTFFTRVYF